MQQALATIAVDTRGKGLTEVTRPIVQFVRGSGIGTGLLTVWCRHTSASLLVMENASPEVLADIADYFEGLAPEAGPYRHALEGPDDMPAHLRTALTDTGLTIPVGDGVPMLGTWQGIFLFEHRRRPHRRELALHVLGEADRPGG